MNLLKRGTSMIRIEHFEQFTVYKSDVSSSFLYADFNNPTMFMNGLAGMDSTVQQQNQ